MFGNYPNENVVYKLKTGKYSPSNRTFRPLSIASRVWIASDLIKPPIWSAITVEGHGRIDYQKLSNAIQIASAANPGSRLILKGNLAWSRWIEIGRAHV